MIKDKRDGETYFNTVEEFKSWLNVEEEIAEQCDLDINECKTEKEVVEFANEYEYVLGGGTIGREWVII